MVYDASLESVGMNTNHYQVGGSLQNDDPNYVIREADSLLYQALKLGNFCYILNARQMGKSSLLVRVQHRLEAEGICCVTLDLSSLGSEVITPEQWYKGIISQLWLSLNLLGTLNLKKWWKARDDLSLIQRLNQFFREILQVYFSDKRLVILIDEIDSILSLPFGIDDFFAWIRSCYNQRSINPEYNRLTFALCGVTTPSDLIQDPVRTPFNIGTAIKLQGFRETEIQPLVQGLNKNIQNANTILQEILSWTDGQPFLTQKLCNLVWNFSLELPNQQFRITAGMEAFWVESIVRSRVIQRWESQDEPEHLRTIRNRILYDKKKRGRLLSIYQKILQGVEIKADDSREQNELILSGLVVKHAGVLKVKNRIYQEVFNLEWVEQKLADIRPYSQGLEAWRISNFRDESRLLRGQALKEAQVWAQGKSLSDLDYQFLAASVELDRQDVQKTLKAERAQEIIARLAQEHKNAYLQRLLLGLVTGALIISGSLGLTVLIQYHQSLLREIEAIATSAEALFASNQKLEALIAALQAQHQLKQLRPIDPITQASVQQVLRQTLYQADESNRWSGHRKQIWDVAFSPDGKIATVSGDRTLKVWKPNGELLQTFTGHQGPIWGVAFSPDSQKIATASWDGTVKLWQMDGTLERTFRGHSQAVWDVTFSPDGEYLASASEDNTVKLWRVDGTLEQTFSGHSGPVWRVTFSPDGEYLASASEDNTVKLWRVDGTLERTFTGHRGPVWSVVFCPNGQKIASASDDQTIKLWRRNGELENTLTGHQATVWDVEFSPDGRYLASASWDGTVKLWGKDGTLLRSFDSHQGRVRGVSFRPDGQVLASVGEDKTVRLWRLNHPLMTALLGHQANVVAVDIRSDGEMIVSGSDDQTLKLWQPDGTLIKTLKGHQAGVLGVAFSPDGRRIASASWDGTIKLWNREGTLKQTLTQHNDPVWDVSFSPDGEMIASGSRDQTIKLWNSDGTLIRTLKDHQGEVRTVVFSPDGQILASGSLDGTVKLWNRQGLLLRTFSGHRDGVIGVAFSPDGQMIASASLDKTIKLWNRQGFLQKTLIGHQAGVMDVSFVLEGNTIVSVSLDHTIKFWQPDGKLLKTIYGHRNGIWGVATSSQGNWMVSAAEDKSILLWDINQVLTVDEEIYACDWLRDYLNHITKIDSSKQTLCPS